MSRKHGQRTIAPPWRRLSPLGKEHVRTGLGCHARDSVWLILQGR